MRVLYMLLDGAQPLDVAGPAQVIDAARMLGAPYQLHYVGAAKTGQIASGLSFSGVEPLPEPRADDWVIVPGRVRWIAGERHAAPACPMLKDREVSWLEKAYRRGARMSSVCAGAFALGEAGALAGRRATTHWMATRELARRFPQTKVMEGVLFVDEGQVISSAGAASCIDMTLHLVEKDQGPRKAAQIARALLLYHRRNGDEQQCSPYVSYRDHLHPGVHRVQDWLIEHSGQPATLPELAGVAGMSVRTFTRDFRQATGLSVNGFRERIRVEQARRLVSGTALPLDEVAYRCGLGGTRQLRRVWSKHAGGRLQDLRRKSAP